MKIILSPYPARLISGNRNPKEYPWWSEVVRKLNEHGHEVVQIGIKGEERIQGVGQFIVGWPLRKLRDIINDADAWLSCDSFLPHYCHTERLKGGVVVWSQSDPVHWGHPENINLLKDRKCLRPLQFQHWEEVPYLEDAFVSPEVVIDAIQSCLTRSEPANRERAIPASLQLANIP